MFRPGHYGVALVLYAPVGCALLAFGDPTAALAGGAGALWLTMLPDWDVRLPFVSHRGPTHTLPFVALVAGFAWVAAEAVGSAVGFGPRAVGAVSFGTVSFGAVSVGPVSLGAVSFGSISLGTFAAGIAALSLVAHLAADLLTPMGVAVLWPISHRRYSVSLTTADSTAWNYALFALGVFATAVAAYLGVELLASGA